MTTDRPLSEWQADLSTYQDHAHNMSDETAARIVNAMPLSDLEEMRNDLLDQMEPLSKESPEYASIHRTASYLTSVLNIRKVNEK
jgi:hypothetical protein